MMRVLSQISLSLVIVFCVSCFKNGESHDEFQQSFRSALSIGDLLEVDIDTEGLKYKYNVIEGDWKGTEHASGSGTLKPLPDFHKNAFLTEDETVAIAIENEVAIGALGNSFFVGVPKRSKPYQLDEITGTYNYVSYCPLGIMGDVTDKTSYGTLQLNQDYTWKLLHEKNLNESNDEPTLSGTFVDDGSGTLRLKNDETTIANVMIRIEDAKEHFVVIDLVWFMAKGIAFAARQSPVVPDQLASNFSAIMTDEMTNSIVGTRKNNILEVKEGGLVLKYDLQFNAPWTGLISAKSNDLVELAGGAYQFFGIVSKRSKNFYGVLYAVDKNNSPLWTVPSQAFLATARK